jgi:transketolase
MATFAAFFTRAHDQIRMAAYSFSNIKIVGSHVGVSIGADGPSQMGLEDLAMFRSIPGCAVLYPCDAYSAEACVEIISRHKGMAYLRTSRPATPILYDRSEQFKLGGSKVLKKCGRDAATVITAGITIFEALKAYDILKKENIFISVIDAYSIQPLDKENLIKTVKNSKQKAIVVEDHFESGGLGDAVASALAGKAEIHHLAIKELPRSGEPAELLDKYGISALHIVQTVKSILK